MDPFRLVEWSLLDETEESKHPAIVVRGRIVHVVGPPLSRTRQEGSIHGFALHGSGKASETVLEWGQSQLKA